jgi:beta-N-acetylhexosaminidase
MNLAPVADANTNPANPVIGVRSFGAEPELVARHVAAFVEGTQRVGVAACAKHFPGHGDTRADSHLELPTVEAGPDELRAGALLPFRAAIEAGVLAVMTGHLLVPALDSAPATLSTVLVTELLRGELGFDGLVVSDALDMGAIPGVEEAAVRALAAGVDALCLGPTLGPEAVERVHGAIVAAARSGQLPADRLAEAARRVEETGRWASVASADGAPDRSVGAVAAARALRVRGDVDAGPRPYVVELVPEPSIAAGAASYAIGDAVRARRPDTRAVRLREPPADLRRLVRGAGDDRVILVLRDATRHPWQQAAASELLGARPDAVVVDLGLPGWAPEGTTASVETYGAGRVNLEAAAALLAPTA